MGIFCDKFVKVCALFIISSVILVFSLTFRRVLSPISFFLWWWSWWCARPWVCASVGVRVRGYGGIGGGRGVRGRMGRRWPLFI